MTRPEEQSGLSGASYHNNKRSQFSGLRKSYSYHINKHVISSSSFNLNIYESFRMLFDVACVFMAYEWISTQAPDSALMKFMKQ